jgi:hypothetical protein
VRRLDIRFAVRRFSGDADPIISAVRVALTAAFDDDVHGPLQSCAGSCIAQQPMQCASYGSCSRVIVPDQSVNHSRTYVLPSGSLPRMGDKGPARYAGAKLIEQFHVAALVYDRFDSVVDHDRPRIAYKGRIGARTALRRRFGFRHDPGGVSNSGDARSRLRP